MNTYVDLDVWKHSRNLVKRIYELTEDFNNQERYGIVSQMRRAAISIPSNIAEGHGRNHRKDSIQFFYISRGSLFELETQLYLSFDLEFIKENTLNEVLEEIIICKKLLNGLIRYFLSQP